MANEKNLDGRTVLVTGSAQGIGKTIAEQFAKEGSNIILQDIYQQQEKLVKVADYLRGEYSADVLYTLGDVSKNDEVKSMVDESLVHCKNGIDVLVNNAGITRDGIFIRMKDDQWESVIDVNLNGTRNFCSHVLRNMIRKKSGAIVNISSIVGVYGGAGQANYAASKAGVIGLTQSLAQEYGAKGVRVNAVAPGFIQTEMTDKLDDKRKDELYSRISLRGEPGSPLDVAKAVVFLASDEAKYITGTVLRVDGGLR